MIKVLHIVSGDLWAGAEIMAYTLLRELAAYSALSLHVVVLNRGILEKRLFDSGVETYLLDESRLSFPTILARSSEVVRRIDPDVVHSHRYKENVIAYLSTLSRCRGLILTATQHGLPELYDRAGGARCRITQALNRWALARKFHMVIAVSEDVKTSLLKDQGFSGDRVTVIHNGIEISEQFQARPRGERLRIGSAGRFFPVKDYPFLVEVAREAIASSDRISFTIAGDGPQFSLVDSKIKQYGLMNRVCLSGFTTDMQNFYRGIDVYISTSLHEGIPMSVLEAMAYGLPVIAPKVGGFQEIVTDGVDGFLIDERTTKAFAEKCILLAQNPTLKAEMSWAARRKVIEHFSAERMAREYHDLYLKLTSISN